MRFNTAFLAALLLALASPAYAQQKIYAPDWAQGKPDATQDDLTNGYLPIFRGNKTLKVKPSNLGTGGIPGVETGNLSTLDCPGGLALVDGVFSCVPGGIVPPVTAPHIALLGGGCLALESGGCVLLENR